MPAPEYNSIEEAETALRAAEHRDIFLQSGLCIGDISHIGPALALRRELGVIVYDGSDSYDRGRRQIADVYVDSFRVPESQVAYVNYARDPLTRRTVKDVINSIPRVIVARSLKLGQSTRVVMEDIVASEESRIRVMQTLRGTNYDPSPDAAKHPDDAQTRVFLYDTKKVSLYRDVVVLWGRRSGVRGGPYPLQDHNSRFMRQLATACLDRGWTVIAAGEFDRSEFGDLMADAGGNTRAGIFFGEFWNELPMLRDRAKQVRMFYILSKELKIMPAPRGLVHVGPRSGDLDAYGFSGQSAIYLVGGNDPDQRMDRKVVEPLANARATLGLTAYNFTRVKLSDTPRRKKGKGFEDNALTRADLEAVLARIASQLQAPL